jgi:hypothetical protein
MKKNYNYTTVNSNVRVTEEKAPTDESIKLLNEFQEKARENLVDSIHVKNNVFEAVALFFQNKFPKDGFTMMIKFELNGIEYKEKFDIDGMEYYEATKQDAIGGRYNLFLNKLALRVSSIMLQSVLDDIVHFKAF